MEPKVWLITGCSSGLGREIAIAARRRGDSVIVTARKLDALDELKQLGCVALTLDITAHETDVQRVVQQAHGIYGRIDILVNNAGYVVYGAVEEASDQDVAELFDTNVFGHLRVTRAALPFMREQRSGTIAFIGSGVGYCAFPVDGIYGAAKVAIAGLAQSLAQEVAPLGIEVTVVDLGMFRTNIMSHDRGFEHSIEDYAQVKEAFEQLLPSIPASDPAKGAQALVEALTKTGSCAGRALPRRLPLGGILGFMEAELAAREKEKNDWKDFAEAERFAFDA